MKARPEQFLSDELISHKSEQFDYIKELHEYLWRFVRCEIPGAAGSLGDYLDDAVSSAEKGSHIVMDGRSTGEEWKQEMMKLNKNQLVNFIANTLKDRDQHAKETAIDFLKWVDKKSIDDGRYNLDGNRDEKPLYLYSYEKMFSKYQNQKNK